MADEVDYLENFRTNLRLLRTYKGLSKTGLARKLKCSPQYIAALENHNVKKIPSLEKLVEIAEALGTTPGRMLDVNASDFHQYIERKYIPTD